MEIDYQDISNYIKEGKELVLCIIINTKGNTPRHIGSKMIVFNDGTTVGTVGGGSIEMEATDVALKLGNKPHSQTFNLRDDVGMICGGEVTIYFEPIREKESLYIFGGGHVGQAIVKVGEQIGFNIIVIDNRDEIAQILKESTAQVWLMDYVDAINKIPYNSNSYFVITTPRHQYDEVILAAIAKKPHKYIGMMSSKEKVAIVKEKFLRNNTLTLDEINKIDMPIGVPIKCETPADIAISIWARIIDIKNS